MSTRRGLRLVAWQRASRAGGSLDVLREGPRAADRGVRAACQRWVYYRVESGVYEPVERARAGSMGFFSHNAAVVAAGNPPGGDL